MDNLSAEDLARLCQKTLPEDTRAFEAIVAQFVGNTVTALAAGVGINNAPQPGKIIQFLIILFVVIIALGIMGLDTALLVRSVTILIAAFGLAFGLVFGLGAKRIVQHV